MQKMPEQEKLVSSIKTITHEASTSSIGLYIFLGVGIGIFVAWILRPRSLDGEVELWLKETLQKRVVKKTLDINWVDSETDLIMIAKSIRTVSAETNWPVERIILSISKNRHSTSGLSIEQKQEMYYDILIVIKDYDRYLEKLPDRKSVV